MLLLDDLDYNDYNHFSNGDISSGEETCKIRTPLYTRKTASFSTFSPIKKDRKTKMNEEYKSEIKPRTKKISI